MNLSNYLQMPPAPAVPPTTSTGPAKGAAAVVGLDSTGNLKMDFAQIMARQFQQMPQLKRQDLAASSSLPKLASLSKDTRDENNAASSQPQERMSERLASHTSETHAYLKNAAQKSSQDEADAQEQADKTDAPRQTRRTHTDNTDTAAPWFNPLTMTAPVQANDPAAADAALTNLPDGTPLQTVALSAQTQLITDPRHAPSPQSLLDFAQSMGMDPEAISQLMGNADLANMNGSGGANAALAAAVNPNLATPPGANQLQASLSAAMQANGMGGQTNDAAAMLTSLTATQIQAQSVGTPSQAVHLPATAQMSTLQMLTPADPNAALNSAMQVAVLPVAPAMANTGSILDVLDMRSADLPESQITALAGLLAESGQEAGDASMSQDPSSQSDNPQSSFAQTLAAKTGAAGAGTDASRGNAANGVNRSMSEVYDRLSEKLSTEMAARMHEQISAGQWKMKFGLRPAHLGGVEVQLEMKDGKLNAQLNAENPMTRELLQNSSQRLREALANLGVQTHQVSVGQNPSGFAQSGSQGQHSGNQPQLGDNLASSARAQDGPTESTQATSTKGSDSLLDLYA